MSRASARPPARFPTLTLGGVGFSLSRQASQQLESQVQAQAIERFKARAAEVAKGFGFAGYTLREVSISSADQGNEMQVRPRMMAMEAKAACQRCAGAGGGGKEHGQRDGLGQYPAALKRSKRTECKRPALRAFCIRSSLGPFTARSSRRPCSRPHHARCWPRASRRTPPVHPALPAW